jgi:lysophospholipase L1-like esterase
MKCAVAAVASALILTGCARTHATTRPLVRLAASCARAGVRLTLVGDSLARGWGASTYEKSFASLVYADLRRTSPQATMRNLGTPGATTDEIAEKEVPRLHTADCSFVVVFAGANDVQKLYTPSHFRSSYAKLLANIRTRLPNGAILVMGLPDVSLAPHIPWILKPIESRLSRNADAAMGEAAGANGAAFVPLYALSHGRADQWKSLLSSDGIHPNDAGYRILANTALPSLARLLRKR